MGVTEKQEYSIWALPPEDVLERVKKLMAALQAEFGGPDFEPHLTLIGAIWQTEDEVHKKFNAAVQGLKPVQVSSEALVYGPSFWTCLYDKITYSPELREFIEHFWKHFDWKPSFAYTPHLSFLYHETLPQEDRKKAHERALELDEAIASISFPITRVVLYKTDATDLTTKSWKKLVEVDLTKNQKQEYSIWALPSEDVLQRVKKLMAALQGEFGGPDFEPHITFIGAIWQTEEEVLQKFHAAVKGLKPVPVNSEALVYGPSFWTCLYNKLNYSPELRKTVEHFWNHFDWKPSFAYTPHLSFLYHETLPQEDRKKAQERALELDETIATLSFPITRVVLYKTDATDLTTKSWKKLVEVDLTANN
ncbi:hypothetical protein Dimus_033094 [Dionaea muscipula]